MPRLLPSIASLSRRFITLLLANLPRFSSPVNDRSMSPATTNVVQVGLGFFFLFVQFNSRGYIQESIFESIANATNATADGKVDPHTGYNGLSLYYLVFTFANLVVSPIIDRLGIQWSMSIGAALTILYEIGFFSINVWYYYVTSILSGIGAALIWPSMGTYLTQNSTEKTLERNSSIVWAMSQASQVVGGMILLLVFYHVEEKGISETALFWTSICFTISLAFSFFIFFTLRAPPSSTYIPIASLDRPTFREELSRTVRLIFTKRMLYLGVVFAYTGIVQSFWTSIFPTCISFTERLSGGRMTVMAISTCMAGVGQLVLCGFIFYGNRLSRQTIVYFGCVCHLLTFIGVYLFFPPLSSLQKTDDMGLFEPNLYVTLVLAFFLGFGDGCWNTQVYAFVGDVFPHVSNEAFALFNFYQSLMTSASLFYSSLIVLPTHLVILSLSAVIAAGCYHRVEILGRVDYFPPIEKIATNESSPSPLPSERSIDSTGLLLPA